MGKPRVQRACRTGLRAFGVALLLAAPGADAEEVWVLSAARDATLVESASGALANGSGPALFAGRTSQAQSSRRRALLAFDVASAIPAGARILRAELVLELSPSHDEPFQVGVHRMLAAWSEGPSVASGGGGAPAQPGDSTWLHARTPDRTWAAPGGDFAVEGSAAAEVGDSGPYLFASDGLAADVQAWLDGAYPDFGWILIGDESQPSTVKRFASRESEDASISPALVLRFERPGGACADLPFDGPARGVCHAYCEARDCDADPALGALRACSALAGLFARAARGARPPCVAGDADSDGIADAFDVCPSRFDPDQLDADGDGTGDACGG